MEKQGRVRGQARRAILDSARALIREKGYCAMTVEDLCAHAGVTKGAFFHHFDSKEALGKAAADDWSEMTGGLFATAPYHQYSDPLDRVMAYIRFRKELVQGSIAEFTCVVGTMVQEIHESSPIIRDACHDSMFGHAATLEADIEQAIRLHGIRGGLNAPSLALHTQAVIQGAFILAKSAGDDETARKIATDQIDHLERYIELLFGIDNSREKGGTHV